MLYAIAVEIKGPKGWVASIRYLSAETQREARIKFIRGHRRYPYRIVAIGPAVGHFLRDNVISAD